MTWKLVLAVLLILSLMFGISDFSHAQAQTQGSLNLEEITWNHATISGLIIMQDSESWWAPSYLNATLRAIGEWNHAIQDFASNYTNYAYLSKLKIISTIAHTIDPGFDAYISWAKKPPSATDHIGYTNTWHRVPSGIIKNSTISLASEDSGGYVLNEVDMQNIALHELGHSLGLGHSSYLGDVMYSKYTLNQPVEGLSTLDLYGVSTVFQWMLNSSNSPYSPQQSSVTLPSNIQYRYLPIYYEDLPPAPPSLSPLQTLLIYIIRIIRRPELLIPIVIVILVAVVIEILYVRVEKARRPT